LQNLVFLRSNTNCTDAVMRIEQDSNRVGAIAVQSGMHRTFEADRLICTAPFPALRRVEVAPSFSEHRRKAIAELRYDTVTRVILQCRSRFWEKDGCNGFGSSDLPQEVFYPTFDHPGTPRIAGFLYVSGGGATSWSDGF
jgi:monoamine oxidase